MKKSANQVTVGEYLIRRLCEAGVRHIFGIPGDYVLSFYDMLVGSPIKLIGTCTESGAAFAADSYARVNGVGAICVTYAVGGLNTVNAIAGAYAEKSPVILISGAPGMSERVRHPLLHHRVRDFGTQKQIFEKITAAAVAVESAVDAPDVIDGAIAECLRQKRPVYIELPRDIVTQRCAAPKKLKPEVRRSDPATLAEALAEAMGMLAKARRPAILAGVEIHRFGLQRQLLGLVEKSGFPIATTLLGKSIISEHHPQCLGVYEGAMGREHVREIIEEADCLLILGALLTDINLGVYTARLDPARCVKANAEQITIKRHNFAEIELRDFINGLTREIPKKARRFEAVESEEKPLFKSHPRDPIRVARLFERMDEFLEDDMIVIADVGDSLFGAADLTIHRRTEFLSPAYYTSMGFAVPAALGAQISNLKLRPIVFVGDGAFQMTGQELSTIARNNLNPIIFVLNNRGYTTERYINEGPYNDIQNWAYHRWTYILERGWGTQVATEGQLDAALSIARLNTKGFSIINVHLDKMDRSDALERLGRSLRKQGGMKKSPAIRKK
ncbi:alpha-keto acid decarboxylase family protein [Candidatus Sumerlaeota bacterium]|nr:alpha-keto acid decarboxylase family protein [Candidatus Sumerlaeota bacterium]